MKIVFAGTTELSAQILNELLQHQVVIELVVTRAPAPIGRKKVITQSPVHEVAIAAGIPVFADNNLAQLESALLESGAELGVVVAFGKILKSEHLLALPKGWINVHYSKLPSYRGAAPVQRAIMNGDSETALTVFQLVAEMDAGPVYISKPVDFAANETTADFLSRMPPDSTQSIIETIAKISEEEVPTPQRGEPSFAPKIAAAEAQISWHISAKDINNLIRATNPEPGAWSELAGTRFKIHRAAVSEGASIGAGKLLMVDKQVLVGTGENNLELVEVQPLGKGIMAAADWYRGNGKNFRGFDETT